MIKRERELDKILKFLSFKKDWILLPKILKELNISLTEEDMKYYEAKLKADKYVEVKTISLGRVLYKISDQGRVFINDNGYSKDKIWSTIQDLKDLLKIF